MWVLDLFTVTGLVYAAAGLVAWWRRPSNGLGVIIVGGALSWLWVAMANTGLAVLAAAGLVLAKLPLAVVVHMLLAFPSGRLQTTAARWTTAAGYVAAVVLEVPLFLFAPRASPGGVLAVTSSPALVSSGTWVQDLAGISVMVVAALILASRLRRAPAAQRRVLLPLDLYGYPALTSTTSCSGIRTTSKGLRTITSVEVSRIQEPTEDFHASTAMIGKTARPRTSSRPSPWTRAFAVTTVMQHMKATKKTPNTRAGRTGRQVTGGWTTPQVWMATVTPRQSRIQASSRHTLTACPSRPDRAAGDGQSWPLTAYKQAFRPGSRLFRAVAVVAFQAVDIPARTPVPVGRSGWPSSADAEPA